MPRTRSLISAKTGLGVPDVLEAIVTRLPPPKGDRDATLKALLIDSWYDAYLGVVVLFRVVDGVLKKGTRIRMMGTKAAYDVDRVGVFTPKRVEMDAIGPARSDSSPDRSRKSPTPASATPSPTIGSPLTNRSRVFARRFPSCSAGCFRSTPTTSRRCARRWDGCGSTMRASHSRWRLPPRSVSVFAAAFSDCCISKSFRSGSSASSIST